MFIQILATAAQAPLQADLLNSSIHRLSGYDRYITGGWLTAATLDAVAVEIYVSDVNVATLYSAVGSTSPAGGLNLIPIDAEVPAGSEIRAIVIKQEGTPIAAKVSLQIDELDDSMAMDPMQAAMMGV